jgi:hypothetical protein
MTTSGRQSSESTSTVRDQAHNMAGKVVEKVQETASRMTGSDQRSDTAAGSASGDRSAPVMEQASEQVTSRLDMGKEYVAETVTGLAQALRQTGQHLRDDGSQPMLAQYADRGAEQIEHFGGYLRRHDTSQLVSDVEGFARRQPMVFAGGAFALGMLAVRFLRSRSQPQGYSPSSAGSTSYGTSLSRQMPSTRPMTGQTSPGTTPRSPSMPPGGYTAGQTAPSGTPTRQPTTPSGSGTTSGATLNPGTPAAPGPGAVSPGTQAERPTPRPTAPPSGAGTSASPGTAAPSSGAGARTGSSTPASERTGSDPRRQP